MPWDSRVRSQVRQWVGQWIPYRLRRAGPGVERRAQLVVLVSVLSAAVWAGLGVGVLVYLEPLLSVSLASGAIALLLAPVLLARTGSVRLVGAWTALNLMWPACVLVATAGLPGAGYLAAAPAAAAMLLGKRSAVATVVVSVAVAIALVWLDLPHPDAGLGGVLIVGLCVLLFGLATLQRFVSDTALHELHVAIDRLREEIERHRRTRETLDEVHRALVDQARSVGRAEVATDVLHNVGNTLSWVGLAAHDLRDRLRESRVARLRQVTDLLERHEDDLGAYLSDSARGRNLVRYIDQLGQHLVAERDALLSDIDRMVSGLAHIEATVQLQNANARRALAEEVTHVGNVVEEAIRYSDATTPTRNVVIETAVANIPAVLVDRHRLVQILVNLLENAKQALQDTPSPRIRVKAMSTAEHLRIAVVDNGIGIAGEDLPRLFRHGFTTRTNGHGFGLHASALAAEQMGGRLSVHSDGPGRGAEFTVEVPLKLAAPADPDEQDTQKALPSA